MAARVTKKLPDSRSQTIEDLLISGELQALTTTLETVITGSGYGSVLVDIRAGRVYLGTISTTIKPAAAGECD
ncbi:MAG: hypothetical protein ACYC3H_03565 [Bellilinea sp.]